MIKIKSLDDIVGKDHHRSGWPYALRCLQPLHTVDGVLLDDFVDRSFGWAPIDRPYEEPWIGIFHKPPSWPAWMGPLDTTNTPARLINSDLFQASLPNLLLAVTFSHYLAGWLRQTISAPVVRLSHPTELNVPTFSEKEYFANQCKQILQVGYTLRNLRAINQLDVSQKFTKTRIRIKNASAERSEQQVRDYWTRVGGRSEVGHVQEIERLADRAYDFYLTRNVVFLELFDSSVNNTTLECIARNTPVIINRLPALEEYLGSDYPLFYDHFDDAASLFNDYKLISGHRYLLRRGKSQLSGEHFCSALQAAICEAI